MIYPTIHRNGTSKRELIDQLCSAGNAVDDAIRSLCDCAPNGRDYYPQGNGAITKADAEHRARIQKLRDVHAELMDLAEHIDDTAAVAA